MLGKIPNMVKYLTTEKPYTGQAHWGDTSREGLNMPICMEAPP